MWRMILLTILLLGCSETLNTQPHKENGGSWDGGVGVKDYSWRFISSTELVDNKKVYAYEITLAYNITFENQSNTTKQVRYELALVDKNGFLIQKAEMYTSDDYPVITANSEKQISANSRMNVKSISLANTITNMQIKASIADIK